MSDWDDDDDKRGFFALNKGWIIPLGVGLIGGGSWLVFHKKEAPKPVREERITMVQLPPPPPPPRKPTPPPVQQPQEQPKPDDKKQAIDDAPKDQVPKPEPAKAPDEPPPSMGSNIKGDGNDGFGLSGSGNGGFVGIGGKGRGGGDAYGYYASQVKARVAEALRQNKRTRSAAFDLKVRLWIDQSGRITRAEAAGGDDSGAAQVLVGVKVADRPPTGMSMPLVASLSARRP